ncbi:MAG: pentapeptide repeat-containing protein [Pseudomonadota bacterium]
MPALSEVATTTATFLGVIALLAAVALLLSSVFEVARTRKLREALGASGVPPALFALGFLVYASIALLLAAGVLVLIAGVIGLTFADGLSGQDDGQNFLFYVLRLAGLTTVLGAVIALPFTIFRLRLTTQQTKTAEESLFNEKINAATQGLYARRQKTEWKRKDGHVHVWEDDIVQRNAAIDRLEGLAEENPAEIPRIARLLSVYVRELSHEVPPKDPPQGASPDDLRNWGTSLRPRSDMQKAAQTLGRLHNVALKPLDNDEIDLRDANLQGCDLNRLLFEKARFEGARMEGAHLVGARLQGANLGGAQLQGAYLVAAQLQGAHLVGARLQGANLGGARLQGAYLVAAQLQGADLGAAQLQGANLFRARFDDATDLSAATLRGAALRSVDFTDVSQITDHLDDMFGDASVTLPSGARPGDARWPKEWATTELGYGEFLTAWRAWQATLPPGWDADNT